jgi:hypothetical protein
MENSIKSILIVVALIFITSCAAKKELAGLKEECQSQRELLTETERNYQTVLAELSEAENRNSTLSDENTRLEERLSAATSRLTELANKEPDCPEAMVDGVVFKVQIGAYKERSLSEDMDTSVNLEINKQGDLQEIVVGQFRDYHKADTLKKQLRAMGVKDAWIVPFKDGKKVLLKTVLPEIEL